MTITRVWLVGIVSIDLARFFHTLKIELIHYEDFQAREEDQQAIFEYIEVFYNRQRKHSTNGYQAPFKY